jgi:hypothetical protein
MKDVAHVLASRVIGRRLYDGWRLVLVDAVGVLMGGAGGRCGIVGRVHMREIYIDQEYK